MMTSYEWDNKRFILAAQHDSIAPNEIDKVMVDWYGRRPNDPPSVTHAGGVFRCESLGEWSLMLRQTGTIVKRADRLSAIIGVFDIERPDDSTLRKMMALTGATR